MFFQNRSSADPEKIKKILQNQQDAIRKYVELNDSRKFCTVQNGPCTALDFFSWKKDKNHLYINANFAHCIEFFRMPKECMELIRGKADIDLVNDYRERTGKIHSFGELCVGSDDIVKASKKPGHFIEIGYIDTDLFLLDVYKVPLFDEAGEFFGSEGYAFNKASRAKLFEGMINQGLKNGCLGVVYKAGDRAVCYKVSDVCNSKAFANGFPDD